MTKVEGAEEGVLSGDWEAQPMCETWELHPFKQIGVDPPSDKFLDEMAEKNGTPMPPRHKSPTKAKAA